MKRSIAIMLTALVATTAGTALVGCGSDDDDRARTAIPRSRLQPTRTRAELSPEEQKVWDERQGNRIAKVMVWPEGSGPPRDVRADNAACRDQLLGDRKLSNANPLIQLTWMTRCLTNKGWQLDPEAKKQLSQ